MYELTIVSVGIGLLLSLFMVECFSLVAGGMIVPGFLALQLNHPERILLTLLAASLTYLSVLGLDHLVILYGRRRITVTLLLGFLFNISLHFLLPFLFASADSAIALSLRESGLGYVFPGLIALWFDRQGFLSTVSMIGILTFCIRLILIVLMGGVLA